MRRSVLLSWLVVLSIVLSLFAVPAFAEETSPLTRAQTAAAEALQAADAATAAAVEADEAAAEAEAIDAQDKSAARQARQSAGEAAAAAEAAREASDKAAYYRDKTEESLNNGYTETAHTWADNAETSRDNARSYQAVAESKLATAKLHLASQRAIADAEEAADAALAQARQAAHQKLTEADDEKGHGAPYHDIIDAARAAIDAAATTEEIQQILDEALAAIAARQVCPCAAFTDVSWNGYYHEAADAMVAAGYFRGVSDTLFDVDGTLTRAQLVTILYRVAGEPDVSDLTLPFADVPARDFYTDAVKWAADRKIVLGTSATTFHPHDPITREQIVVILFRYAEASAPGTLPDSLIDLKDVSGYAMDAVAWAVENGIINGIPTPDGLAFQPHGNATRAQCAAIVYRFLNK